MKYLALILAIFFPILASAAILGNDLSLVLSPDTPGPGESFSAEARSYGFDTSHADFTWYLNGKKVDEGQGTARESFTAGRAGSKMDIKVVADSENGIAYNAESKITTGDVDLILNPLTYVPAWYPGAALASPGSVVEVYAIPHLFSGGSEIDPANLIYDWSLDGDKIADQSGTGKSVFRLKLSNLRNSQNQVSLFVASAGGSTAARKTIAVAAASPKILFYQSSPLTGVKTWASTFFAARPGANFSILAEPFFFSLEDINNLNIAWSANGETLNQSGAENPFLLSLKTPSDAEANALFSLKISDKKNIFQQTEANLSVTAIQQ